MVDNSAAVYMINKMGSSHTEIGNDMVVAIWEFCINNEIWLTAAHVPGSLNVIADAESRRLYTDAEWMLHFTGVAEDHSGEGRRYIGCPQLGNTTLVSPPRTSPCQTTHSSTTIKTNTCPPCPTNGNPPTTSETGTKNMSCVRTQVESLGLSSSAVKSLCLKGMYPQFLMRLVGKDLEGYLTGIRNGESKERAKLFATVGSKGRKELIWNCPMGHFTDSEHHLVADTLAAMYSPTNSKELDNIMKVLFPEVLIKIYMDHQKVDYATAEELFNYDVYQ
ncbi:Hypothetical predicted protein, partial [Paramuricea clavata]